MILTYYKGQRGLKHLRQLVRENNGAENILLVLDSIAGPTMPFLKEFARTKGHIRIFINDFGTETVSGIQHGVDVSDSDTEVVAMSHFCECPRQVPELVNLIYRGVDIAHASRYSPSGQQNVGPRLKRVLSRHAEPSFPIFTGVATFDANDSPEALNENFPRKVEIGSAKGSENEMAIVA